MKNIRIIILLTVLLSYTFSSAQDNKTKTNSKDTTTKTVTSNEETDSVNFVFISNPPVYPGCEGLNTIETKKCMSRKVQAFIGKKFNIKIAEKLKISNETIKILAQFTIDKKGKVTNIKIKSKYKKLAKEAKRVIKKLPRMKPGKLKDRIVKVTYTLPIIFKIE